MRDEREDEAVEPGPETRTTLDEVEILGIEAVDEAEAGAAEPEAARLPESTPPAEPEVDVEAALRAEIVDLKDRQLRLLADFDNFRKRSEREREERARYALAEPLRELLPVIDNLDRALAAQGGVEDLRRGVEMIARQHLESLRRLGVTPVPGVGAAFDPRLHEAVLSEESPAVTAPTVVEELQRGYLLHDRLLRPAMVRVAVPVDAGSAAPGDAVGGAGAEEAQ